MNSCKIASIVIVLTLVGLAAPGSAAGPEFETVTMIYVGGEDCIAVDKPNATVFRKTNPRKVEWAVTVQDRYWEIRYQESSSGDPDKKDGQGDYFKNSGRLDIRCPQSRVRTVVPDAIVPENAYWPYKIRVYECDNQRKGDFLCELDPNIDWGD